MANWQPADEYRVASTIRGSSGAKGMLSLLRRHPLHFATATDTGSTQRLHAPGLSNVGTAVQVPRVRRYCLCCGQSCHIVALICWPSSVWLVCW